MLQWHFILFFSRDHAPCHIVSLDREYVLHVFWMIFQIVSYLYTVMITIGTLRCEDGDGRKNVAEKVNSRSFNLHRDYSKSLTLSNVGEPF